MAVSEAIVTYKDDKRTLVRPIREKSCEGCADQASCPEANQARSIDTKVLNNVGAEKGDTVLLSYKSGTLLKITFLVYVFPIIALIIGAMIGDNMAEKFGMTQSGSAALFAFSFFFIAVFFIKIYNDRVEKKDIISAEILKVIN